MKDNAWIYDLIWAPPIEVEIDPEFIGWLHAQYAMKIAEINAGREKREREERRERNVPMWKKLIGVL